MATDRIDKIVKILESKNATQPCPACGHDIFTVVDGDFAQEFITHDDSPYPLAPFGVKRPLQHRSIYYIVLICENCGFIRQHAKKPLGIPTLKKS